MKVVSGGKLHLVVGLSRRNDRDTYGSTQEIGVQEAVSTELYSSG